MLVAVAAMGFVACQDGVDEVVVKPQDTVSIEFTASFDETRSQFGEKVENSGYPSSWSGGEQIMLSLNETTPVIAQVESEGATANFTATLTSDGNTEGSIFAFSPAGTYENGVSTPGFTGISADYDRAYVYIPSEQSPIGNSCDENVHLLAAECAYTDGIPASANLSFAPVAAFGKMTITDFEGTIANVTLESSEPLAGNAYYYYAGEKVGTLVERASGYVNTLTLDATNVQNNIFWFGCIPAVLDDKTLTVVVTDTEEKTYTKKIDLTGKKLAFRQGRVANFAVSFKDIAVDEVVDDTVNIADGKYAIIAFNADKTVYSAMTTTPTSTSTVRMSSVNVDFDVNTAFTTTDSSLVWNITKVDGGYTFTNNEGKYLSWSSGNSAKFDTNETVMSIEKSSTENGTYNVYLNKAEDRYLQKNNSEQYFAFYTSDQRKDLYIVPVTVVEDTTPSLSVNQDSVELPYTESTGNIDVTIKNLSVDEIEIVSSADWLTATLTEDALNYEAEANEAGVRSATVTLTAGNLTATITFMQAAKPAEVTGVWTLVTDASTLAVGDQIIIAALDYDYALSTTQNNNNRGQEAVTKSDTTVTINEKVQILTLEAGTVDGTFAFYTGSGYLYAASSSNNYLRTQTDLSANSSWNITIAATGVATIIAQGTNTRNCMQYNSSSSLFACYSSASQKAIAIYKLTE